MEITAHTINHIYHAHCWCSSTAATTALLRGAAFCLQLWQPPAACILEAAYTLAAAAAAVLAAANTLGAAGESLLLLSHLTC